MSLPALQYGDQHGADCPAGEGDDHCPEKDNVSFRRKEKQIGEANRDLGQYNSDSEHGNACDSNLWHVSRVECIVGSLPFCRLAPILA
jgi:hypothetical protein